MLKINNTPEGFEAVDGSMVMSYDRETHSISVGDGDVLGFRCENMPKMLRLLEVVADRVTAEGWIGPQ